MTQNILKALSEIERFVVNFDPDQTDLFDPEMENEICIREEVAFIREKLDISASQAALLGVIIEEAAGKRTSFQDIARAVYRSYLDLLAHIEDFHVLRDKGYLRINGEKLSVPAEAMAALMENRPFEKTPMSGMSTSSILSKMKVYFQKVRHETMSEDMLLEEVDQMVAANPESGLAMGLAKHIAPLKLDASERYLFYLVLHGTYFYDGVFCSDTLRGFYTEETTYDNGVFSLECSPGELSLVKEGIIEPVSEDGLVDYSYFRIRRDVVEDLLKDAPSKRFKDKRIQLEDSAKFVGKELFYNEEEEKQVARLAALLDPANLNRVFTSMKEKGMRTGFTCLFYGAPGTGKTETAQQLAKATGRKVMSVDAATLRDKYVGESEKNARRIFSDYRMAVEENEHMPILLLNEADGIIGKRFDHVERGAERMENSVQNIFLEEMERFNGILIATTNLTRNLDPAFERRFLFKIRFEKPSEAVSCRIWRSIIPELSEEEAQKLSAAYSFSGGQIENIARKRSVDAVLGGTEPDFEALCSYCREETLADSPARKPIGF